MTLSFEGTVVVPIANPDDGRQTGAALAPRIDDGARAVLVYVVEKSGGGIDKVSVEQSEDHGAETFAAATAELEGTSGTVETEVLYGTDVVETILGAAEDHAADAVVFVARESGRLSSLLSGDHTRTLIEEATLPVVSLPRT